MASKKTSNRILGIDIGGTGIKGSIVDITTGKMVEERFRIPTPHPAEPKAVLETIHSIIDHFAWKGPIGCGFPGVVQGSTILTAANLDKGFVGFDLAKELSSYTGQHVKVINDADAAGLAEVHFGAGLHFHGLSLLITIGTGLGTALVYEGRLIPNIEVGHLLMKHKDKLVDAEKLASESARHKKKMSWKGWSKHFSRYLEYVHALLCPELIILGGGGAEESDKFMERIKKPCEIRVATLKNQAGIIGAALAAADSLK